MTTSPFTLFLSDCTDPTDTGEGPTDEEMYGVYTSWCLLRREGPASPTSFWSAMRQLGIGDARRAATRIVRPGLRMKGPAMADYILASQPSLI